MRKTAWFCLALSLVLHPTSGRCDDPAPDPAGAEAPAGAGAGAGAAAGAGVAPAAAAVAVAFQPGVAPVPANPTAGSPASPPGSPATSGAGPGPGSSSAAANAYARSLSAASPPSPPSTGLFGGPSQGAGGLIGIGQSGIPQMIGDQGPNLIIRGAATATASPTIPQPFPPTPLPHPPSPRLASSLSPAVRGLKISENQSPRPQDRFFFTTNYFADVNGPLNRRFESPVNDLRVYREIFGIEKTFADGLGSVGVRMPIDSLKSNPTVPARFQQFGGLTTAVGDIDIFVKYILRRTAPREA